MLTEAPFLTCEPPMKIKQHDVLQSRCAAGMSRGPEGLQLAERPAGAGQARVLVIAIDDVEQSIALTEAACQHFPQLTVVARARNVQHDYALRDRGVTLIDRETMDSALFSARRVLEQLGWLPHQARQLSMRFRQHLVDQVERMYPHHRDEQALVSMAKQGRQQLEELFAQEREALAQRQSAGRWDQATD